MILKHKHFLIILLLFLIPKAESAETLYLYKGNFNRDIKIEELYKFKNTKKSSNKLKSLIKITNQTEKELFNILSYEIEVPLKASSRLMNSTIGEVFLSRLSKIIHPNKIYNKEIGTKAIRSAIILGSSNNNEKINLLDFFQAYPNKNIAINLNALDIALKKVNSLKELIEFYSDSPLKKLKDGSPTN